MACGRWVFAGAAGAYGGFSSIGGGRDIVFDDAGSGVAVRAAFGGRGYVGAGG